MEHNSAFSKNPKVVNSLNSFPRKGILHRIYLLLLLGIIKAIQTKISTGTRSSFTIFFQRGNSSISYS